MAKEFSKLYTAVYCIGTAPGTQYRWNPKMHPFSFHTHLLSSFWTAVVTGVVPSPFRFLPSIFIAHRVQQPHCSSIFRRVLRPLFHTSTFQLLLDKPWVTGVVPSPSRFSPSILVAHRVQHSHCSSNFRRVLLTHAPALSVSQFVHKKKPPRMYTSIHSGRLELTKLTCTYQARG